MQDPLTLARPYAKAAFEFALSRKAISSWESFLKIASDIMNDPQTLTLRQNPHSSEEQLLELLRGVLGKLTDEFMAHFLKLLALRQRLALLPAVFQLFLEYKAEYEKNIEVNVFAASPLTSEQLQTLTQKLETRFRRKVTLHEHAAPHLLGGILIRASDFVIDGSVRGRLQRLTHALTD